MTWARLSDEHADRPEVDRLSDAAFRTDIEALLYCNRVLSDGFLPERMFQRITVDRDDPDAIMDELVEARLWERVDGGYQRDWSEQSSSDDVRKQRADHAARQRRYEERKGERAARHARGDHSLCQYCAVAVKRSDASPDASDDASPDARPSPPIHSSPTPSDPPKEGGGEEERTARAVAPKRRSGSHRPKDTTDDRSWMAPPGTEERRAQNRRLNEAIRASGLSPEAWKDAGGPDDFIASERARHLTQSLKAETHD